MLRPEEIRIGNKVTDQYYDSFKTIIIVDSINDKGINLRIQYDGNWPELTQTWIEPDYSFDELYGIPILEEHLVNKFDEIKVYDEEDRYMYSDYELEGEHDVLIWLGRKKEFLGYEHIKYLHELQNLCTDLKIQFEL